MEKFLELHCYPLSYCLYTVSLEQTVPSDGSPVCPGNTLVYECVTTLGDVTWHVGGFTQSFISSELNVSKSAYRFDFKLIETDGTILVSTASIPAARPNDTGIELKCTESVEPLTVVVTVSG